MQARKTPAQVPSALSLLVSFVSRASVARADDGTTDLVSIEDALGELIANGKRGKRRRKAAEEGAIPKVRCFARHMHTACVWHMHMHAYKKTRR